MNRGHNFQLWYNGKTHLSAHGNLEGSFTLVMDPLLSHFLEARAHLLPIFFIIYLPYSFYFYPPSLLHQHLPSSLNQFIMSNGSVFNIYIYLLVLALLWVHSIIIAIYRTGLYIKLVWKPHILHTWLAPASPPPFLHLPFLYPLLCLLLCLLLFLHLHLLPLLPRLILVGLLIILLSSIASLLVSSSTPFLSSSSSSSFYVFSS